MVFRDDLNWWKAFATMFNGCASVISLSYDNCVSLYSDASMKLFSEDWFYGLWADVELPEFNYPDHFVKGPSSILCSSAERELWPSLCRMGT